MNWWNEEGMINCAWMLCHGNWKYILWNKDLGDKSEALKYGCISEEYLSDYGKLVFGNYFDNNIKRVKNNSVYINRNEKQEEDEKKKIIITVIVKKIIQQKIIIKKIIKVKYQIKEKIKIKLYKTM